MGEVMMAKIFPLDEIQIAEPDPRIAPQRLTKLKLLINNSFFLPFRPWDVSYPLDLLADIMIGF